MLLNSEGAIPHNVVYYQQRSIAHYQVSFYAYNYFELLQVVSSTFKMWSHQRGGPLTLITPTPIPWNYRSSLGHPLGAQWRCSGQRISSWDNKRWMQTSWNNYQGVCLMSQVSQSFIAGSAPMVWGLWWLHWGWLAVPLSLLPIVSPWVDFMEKQSFCPRHIFVISSRQRFTIGNRIGFQNGDFLKIKFVEKLHFAKTLTDRKHVSGMLF